MSFEIARAVWNYTGTDLNGVQTAILARMAWYASDGGRDIYPSLKKLCQQTKFGETAVREAIKYLIKNEFLTVSYQSSGHHTNQYCINLKRLELVNEFDDKSSSIELSTGESAKRGPRETNPSSNGGYTPRETQGIPLATRTQYTNNKNNIKNNNVVDKTKTANRAIGNELTKLATSLGVDQFVMDSLAKQYPQDKIFQKLKLMSRTPGVTTPGGWLRTALKQDYPQPENSFQPVAICAVRGIEETQAYLASQPEIVSTPQAKAQGIKSLKDALKGFNHGAY